jgi:gliding motility-associated-like protein
VDERGRTDNNTVERTYTVQPPPAPDLVAAEVRAVEGSPSNARVADTLSVVCEYGNQGEEDTPSSFAVRIAQGGTELRVFDVPGVAMGETRQTDPVPVALQDQGETEISCTVDPNEQIDERGRLDNNTAVLPVSVQRPEQLPVSPNPFTPNGDGVNDEVRFKVERYGLTQPVLSVYTFNGRQLRTIDQLQGGELRWDGTDASGSAQPPGVYLYVVRDGGRTVASGHITLAR